MLYYYFPDKNALYAAVLEHVINQSFDEMGRAISAINDCHEAMMFALDKRIEFVTRYYNLLEYSVSAVQQVPDVMACVLEDSKDKERSMLVNILKKGIDTGQLQVDDLNETAEILLFALVGMRFSILKDIKGILFPTKEEFDRILTLQKKMASVFLNGLRNTAT
ncbi:MAG TPA: TetR/AcrR family transcriptional regulator [Parapedobacter sp.]|nr:TetR/AcrR family transcriptional regulator [Parapedobacter sp.]